MKFIIKKNGKIGRGLFAERNIRKGEIIFHKDYRNHKKIVKTEDVNKLAERDQNHVDYIGYGRYAVDYSPSSMINHSCEPNSYVRYKNFLEREVIALKRIKKGEQICMDYVIDTTGKWKMKCYCRSENCRKTIYSNYFKLPKDLQRKYWKFVPRWKRRMLRKD